MMTNVGVLDGVLRFALGAALLGWSYGVIGRAPPEMAAWAIWALGAAFALTGLFRNCPLYAYFGVDSCAPYPGDDGP